MSFEQLEQVEAFFLLILILGASSTSMICAHILYQPNFFFCFWSWVKFRVRLTLILTQALDGNRSYSYTITLSSKLADYLLQIPSIHRSGNSLSLIWNMGQLLKCRMKLWITSTVPRFGYRWAAWFLYYVPEFSSLGYHVVWHVWSYTFVYVHFNLWRL